MTFFTNRPLCRNLKRLPIYRDLTFTHTHKRTHIHTCTHVPVSYHPLLYDILKEQVLVKELGKRRRNSSCTSLFPPIFSPLCTSHQQPRCCHLNSQLVHSENITVLDLETSVRIMTNRLVIRKYNDHPLNFPKTRSGLNLTR